MHTDHPRRWRIAPLVAALALGWLLVAGVAAQEATPEVVAPTPVADDLHPVTLDRGTCGNLDPTNTVLLGTVEPWGESGHEAIVLTGPPLLYVEKTVERSLDSLRSTIQPNAIVVRQSTDDFGQVLACGDVRGPVEGGRLAVALRAVSGSNIAGVAILDSDQGGFLGLGKSETRISVYVVPNAGAESPNGTPTAAENSPRQ